MKVKDLIGILTQLNPELDVALCCDHSQTPMKPTGWGITQVVSYDHYMMEEIHTDDATGDEHPVVIIEAM